MTTFRIPPGLKNLTPKDPSRYTIAGADVRPEPDAEDSALITVCDGRALAVLETSAENLGGRLMVPRDSLPTGKTEVTATRDGDGDGDRFVIRARGKAETLAHCAPEGDFPPVSDVIPDPKGYRVVCRLNVGLLHKLAQALDPEDKALTILCRVDTEDSVRKPLIVLGAPNTLGVIMPVIIDATDGDARVHVESMRERIRRAFLPAEALRAEDLERAKAEPAPVAEAA